MKQCRLVLMLALLMVAMGSFAQTTVEFVAGVDNGSQKSYKTFADVADKVEKDGVTMSGTNATFDASKYSVKNRGWSNKQLTFSSAKNITKIEFVGGENLSKLAADGFSADAAIWTGTSASVTFTVSGEAKYAKAIVTIQSKDATTLAFARGTDAVYTDFETHYTLPALTLMAGDNELTGQAISLKSLNPDIVTLGADNAVTPLKPGTATIEATFAGTDAYEGSAATLTLNVVESKNIFHESFDQMSGEGGNDGNWNLTSTSGKISTDLCDNAGWSVSGSELFSIWSYNAAQCVRVEMSSGVTTPALANLSGDAVIIFRAGQNRDAGTSVNLSVSGGGQLLTSSVTLEQGAFNTYAVVVRNATPQTRVSFSCGAFGCFYLDDVRVEKVVCLDEGTDNRQALADHNIENVNIAVNRTFTPDAWGTICLPFDVEADQLATLFGEGTQLKQLAGWDEAQLTLSFKDAGQGIVAGQPYLIKPTNVAAPIVVLNTLLEDTQGYAIVDGITFTGLNNPTKLQADDAFLGYDQEAGVTKLYNPDTTQEGGDVLRAFRAFFSGLPQSVADVKVNVDGVVTGIESIDGADGNAAEAGAKAGVYTIGGQYVGTSTQGLAKGVYVAGGKKIVIK